MVLLQHLGTGRVADHNRHGATQIKREYFAKCISEFYAPWFWFLTLKLAEIHATYRSPMEPARKRRGIIIAN